MFPIKSPIAAITIHQLETLVQRCHTKPYEDRHTQKHKKQATAAQSKVRQDESDLRYGSCPVDGSGDRKSTRLPESLLPSIS